MRKAVALALLLGCGTGPKDNGPEVRSYSKEPWAQGHEGVERARFMIDKAVQFWGGEDGLLDGWTIEIHDTLAGVYCTACGGATIPGRRTIVVSTAFGPCVEAAPIPHEVGHAVLYEMTGDADGSHRHPWWAMVRPAGAQYCQEAR